jgi:hypothetical protein
MSKSLRDSQSRAAISPVLETFTDMTPRHRAEELRRFLNLIERSVPAHLDVHVVLDTSSTHKTPGDPALADPPPALHADLQLMAQPRRALVRRTDHEMDQTQRPPLGRRPRRVDPHLDHQLERRPQTVRLAEDRRRDPRQPASHCQRISDSDH